MRLCSFLQNSGHCGQNGDYRLMALWISFISSRFKYIVIQQLDWEWDKWDLNIDSS